MLTRPESSRPATPRLPARGARRRQVTFMNYVQRALGWSVARAGAVLSLSGMGMAVFPPLLLRVVRPRAAVESALLVYAGGMAALSLARTDAAALAALLAVCAGSSALPCMLGYLANLARPGESGAMQGAAETIRTACAAVGGPALSAVFAVCLAGRRVPLLPGAGVVLWPGAVYLVSAVLLVLSWACFRAAASRYAHLDTNAAIAAAAERKPAAGGAAGSKGVAA
jgi:hypothetical protein